MRITPMTKKRLGQLSEQTSARTVGMVGGDRLRSTDR
jgi:hypothetical protein